MLQYKRLPADRQLLLVIDAQERLVPAMEPDLRARLLGNLVRLGAARKALGFPALLTEQYPEGLGPTVAEVRAVFPDVQPHSKLCFAASEDPEFEAALTELAPSRVVVAGMETHICVFQTVRDLRLRGLEVCVLSDAVASRTRENFEVGLELARALGAVVTSTEAFLFDLLGRAGSPEFKLISKLVR